MENKIVLVTGGAKGIGAACVKVFAEEGAKVVLNYKSSRDEAENILRKFPENILLVQGDMSEEKDIKKVFDEAEKKWGKVNILVNNAGIVDRKKSPELLGETFMEVLKVNTVGPYLVTREFAIRLGKGKGVVVNMGSMRAFVPTVADYSASKAALHSMTVSFAKELAPNVRVNAVAPGFTKTDLHKDNFDRLEKESEKALLKRYSMPEEIADAVFFLASDKAKGITGTCLLIDNGRSLYN